MTDADETTVIEWEDASGQRWRVVRWYSPQRQQWEACIDSHAGTTWHRRESMVIDGPEVFET